MVSAVSASRRTAPWGPPRAPETSPSGPDPGETLRELTELHQRGVLTDAEFEALRAPARLSRTVPGPELALGLND